MENKDSKFEEMNAINKFNNDLDQAGKVTVITGGASGIGRAIALTFAKKGSNLAIFDINAKEGKAVCGEITKNFEVNAEFYNCDISNYELVKMKAAEIINNFGKVDNIICAAGFSTKESIEKIDINSWNKAIDINLNGTFYIIKSFIADMIARKSGCIIIIGSATIYTGSGGGVHYAATKAAQYGLMKGLAHELLSKGIRINIITPHIIDTPLLRSRYPDTPEINKKLAERVPIGRIGRPQDIANIALFLASSEAEYICGAEILADGGAIFYKR